ncbi:peptidoglycan-binding protein [Streptomyces sp. NPDC058372]|uniref:peptidoglycan-binding protein n=1 Tax=Streptomyces sp. NPDC058372 TaxID=3346464 RepID=UPI00365CB52C
MPPWKTLPEHLDPQARRLVDRMRRLKDATGLSFTALATRTSYSRSSWERYLNGRKLPPAEAVTELAVLSGADPDRMLALHTLAAQTWTAQPPAKDAAPAAGPEPGTDSADPAAPANSTNSAAERDEARGAAEEPAPRPAGAASRTGGVPEADTGGVAALGSDAPDPAAEQADPAAGPDSGRPVVIGAPATAAKPARSRSARRTLLAAGAALVVVAGVLAVVLTLILPGRGTAGTGEEEHRRVAVEEFAFEPGRTYACDIHRFEGRLYAGRSETTEALLQQITTSWDVVEAQCLLEHRGYRIGGVDGAYGAATERAVKRLQDKEGLVVDGIMGPHTWEALRR